MRTPGSYASVNGLNMYYEIHGTGEPLVLLHGALSAIGTSFGKLLPSLAQTRQVIAVEQQAHGHTADIALTVAVRHPDLVRKLVLAAGTYNSDGFHPGILAGIETVKDPRLCGRGLAVGRFLPVSVSLDLTRLSNLR